MSDRLASERHQGRLALVDCNNFFCSCERVFDPSLVGVPVVVLSNNDGCIISRSQEAKDLGIPMGAPLHQQKEVIRKHSVRVFSSNYTLYGDMSARVMSVLKDAVPAIEIYSIDEAFLRLPAGFVEENARELRARILQWTGIPVCIGIAPTKLLAKLTNRIAKKNKAAGGVFDFTSAIDPDGLLAATSCGDLWGVGKNLSRRLTKLGIHTALDLRLADPVPVRKSLGVIGERMLRELNGISCLELEEMPPSRKGVMASRSFGNPVETLDSLEEALANHAARASEKIRRFGLLATHLEVFLQTNRFRKDLPQYCPSQGQSMPSPTASTSEVMRVARDLLRSIYRPGYRYKKAGIMLAGLVPEAEFQPGLFDPTTSKGRRLDIDKIVDEINLRFGDARSPVITRASMGTECSGKGWKMKAGHHSPHYTTDWREIPIVKA
jgi:DNA polymerase V